MKRILYVLSASIFVAIASQPLPAVAQSSCSAWKSTCYSRCTGLGPQCKPNCANRAATCMQTGCFNAVAEGRQYCGLKKK